MTTPAVTLPVGEADREEIAKAIASHPIFGSICSDGNSDVGRAADSIALSVLNVVQRMAVGAANNLAESQTDEACRRTIPTALRSIPSAELRALSESLEPFVFGDPLLEKILYGDMPDDTTGTITVKVKHFRAARKAHDTIRAMLGGEP